MARFITFAALGAALVLSAASALAQMAPRKPDPVRFGTNWVAEAEHGGYYQALVDGTYARYELDVTLIPGGPQANNRLLLPTGRIDFIIGANMLQAFSAVEQNIPTVVVAAHFQKDPLILMSHPGQGLDTLEDLKKAGTIFVGADGFASYYQWLKTDYGFTDAITKPYTFNPGPFIADKRSAQQGYATSEPLAVEKEGKFKPNVFLLADYGFNGYSTTLETRRELVEKNPDLVQRFVDASTIGWYNYLYGDNRAANARIKKDNPEMTDEQIAFGIARMKEYGIVDSGDSLKAGIGAMTDEHVKQFFERMARAGVVRKDLDYRKSYTLTFVNKGVGLDLRPKN